MSKEERWRRKSWIRHLSVCVLLSVSRLVSVPLYIRVNLKSLSSPPGGGRRDEKTMGLSGQSSPLQLPRLLQLFNPSEQRWRHTEQRFEGPPTQRETLPVSAASQKPHDLPGCLVLLLRQERPPEGQNRPVSRLP